MDSASRRSTERANEPWRRCPERIPGAEAGFQAFQRELTTAAG